ncbi:hypothetical protein MFIFM68171_01715 [Madurella fahalii]|uniref:Heterokaryon incompatibility domain-containing protein n=1 Tax=Madurella fahalii TaxID=1157608 RepID=A0ABQ0G1S1_9PEZI
MSTTAFFYTPIDPRRREIRILTLFPGSPDDPIHCHITTHELNTTPTYNALSYVWGEAASSNDPKNAVLLDNIHFPVTANLFSALRHLRSPEAGRCMTFWIDAICINQADLDERSQQVAIMRDIYASAERVIIWLGEDDEATRDGVFDMIQELDNIKGDLQDENLREKRKNMMHQCAHFFFSLSDSRSRPWFSRVWILQELAMAKTDPLVVCGWRRVPWSALMNAWKAIARDMFTELGRAFVRRPVLKRQDDGLRAQNGTEVESAPEEGTVELLAKIKLDVLDDLLNSRRSKGGESLRRLLILSRTSQSTNPRDKVYGLLGLLSPDETSEPYSIPIPINYRKPVWEVYSDAVSHIFSRGEGPYFLSGVFLPGKSSINSFPSWVPDLSCQTAETATQPAGMQFYPPEIMSASGAGAQCRNGRRLPDKRTLRVEGLFVDVIDEVIPLGKTLGELVLRLPHIESVAEAAKQRLCSFQEAKPLVASLMDCFKRKEPLWRTLICNRRWMSGHETPPETYEDMYRALLSKKDLPSGSSRKPTNEYEESLGQSVGSRAFFTTHNGFVGTCIVDGRPGDVLALWFGSPVPFVLRTASRSIQVDGVDIGVYSLVGASYVGGIMGGEMVDELYCEDLIDSMTFYVI